MTEYQSTISEMGTAMEPTYGPVAIGRVRQAIHAGIRRAERDYFKLSGADVCAAPEYYLTVKIADALKELRLNIDLEYSVNQTLELAGARQPGPIPADIRQNGRFDFVARGLNNIPRFVGEVKHPVRVIGRLDRDLNRLCRVLHYGNNNSFQAGIIAFYAAKKLRSNSREKLLELIQALEGRSEEFSKKKGCKVSMDYKMLENQDEYCSASVCLIISR